MKKKTIRKNKTYFAHAFSDLFIFFKKMPTPLYVFVFIALLSGLIFIKDFGSFSGPDLNRAHYRAALALATGQSFTNPVKKDHGKVHYINGGERYFESGEDCIKNSVVSNNIGNPLVSDKMNECIESYDKNLSSEQKITIPAILQYPPLGYIPQAIGLKIGMETNIDPIHAQTIARFLNLITYIVIVAASIFILPRGKWLAAFIGLLPTSIFLASSLSADGMNIAWSFLFTAYVLRLYLSEKNIGKKQILSLIVLGVGLFLLKVAYAPLTLLILAFKRHQMKPVRKWILFGSIIVTGSTLYLIWSSNWGSLSSIVDIPSNLSLMIHNLPKAVAGILINILYLPMQIFNLPQTIYLTTAIIVCGVAVRYICTDNFPRVTIKKILDQYGICILAAIAALASLGLTYAALLLTWTDIGLYGWINIQGFQGRYVMPLLPLLLSVYGFPKNTKNSDNEK